MIARLLPGLLPRGAALARAGGGALLDALLPPSCLTCEEAVSEQGTLCAACFSGLHLLSDPLCDCCGLPFEHAGQAERRGGALTCPACAASPPPWERARAALAYDDASKRLILPLKYADRTELARPLARQMASAGRALLARAEFLVPVPLHRWRLLSRRYNQAALLARHLSRLSGVPCRPDALRRARRTAPLGEMAAQARAAAVEGAFRVPPRAARRLADRRILLVDDVLTSGATASACARALLSAGARAVDVLAAARVPDPRLGQVPEAEEEAAA